MSDELWTAIDAMVEAGRGLIAVMRYETLTNKLCADSFDRLEAASGRIRLALRLIAGVQKRITARSISDDVIDLDALVDDHTGDESDA